MSKTRILASALFSLFLLNACSVSPDALRKTLEKHPEIVFEVIEKNPQKFQDSLRKSQAEFQKHAAENQRQEQEKALQDDLKSPKKPNIDAKRAIRGSKDAEILLVEYSDFQCPYCRQGFETVEEFRKKLGTKVRFVFKHLPLSFHPLAMPAAKRFEAIALQDNDKAYRFHDEVFRNQDKLSGGEKFLDDTAKKVGADVGRMKKDMEGDEVKKRIEADITEAKDFGIRGTPGFVLNGIVIRGALPVAAFEEMLAKRPTAP